MKWDVIVLNEVSEWWATLTNDQQDAITARLDLLKEYGPRLGRPTVDTITGSALSNLKELRASKSGALRLLFIFDPIRRAVLLVGGNKTGEWSAWYEDAIPRAEAVYAEYLDELRKEGLIQ